MRASRVPFLPGLCDAASRALFGVSSRDPMALLVVPAFGLTVLPVYGRLAIVGSGGGAFATRLCGSFFSWPNVLAPGMGAIPR